MRISLDVWAATAAAVLGVMAAPVAGHAADTHPEWIRQPGLQAIMGVWPREALQRGVEHGAGTIRCIVTTQGGVRDCHVVSETPVGDGFGAAALALAPQFVLKPATHDGLAVESEITVPIRFNMDMRTAQSFVSGINTTRAAGLVRVYSGPLAWTQAPTVADLIAAYPTKARAEKASGHVALDCRFTKTGRLADCFVLREEPSGVGFRHAAIMLAEKFQGPTQDAEGHAMEGSHMQLAFAFPAEALTPPGPGIGTPQWAALPTPADLAAAQPARAKAAGALEARVVLQCVVGDGGALTACAVQAETPTDLGYGSAALSLAGHFRVGLWTEEGLPTVGGAVRLPIHFDYSAPSSAGGP